MEDINKQVLSKLNLDEEELDLELEDFFAELEASRIFQGPGTSRC